MAVLDVHFYSDVLQVSTAMTVILPQRPLTEIGLTPSSGADGGRSTGSGATESPAPPLLYLLHGLGDDETTWLHRTSIDRYAANAGLAVVMPRGDRSFYQDEVHGHRYWTFLTEELPAVVHDLFRVSTARENTFVAGLSMGGYGAMRWALAEPWRFAAAATLSGALDLGARAGALAGGQITGGQGLAPDDAFLDFAPDVRDNSLGGSFTPGGDNDVFALLRRSAPGDLPALYVSCGRQDELLDHSERFLAAARAVGADPHSDFPDGVHSWDLWDAQIQHVIDWLPLG